MSHTEPPAKGAAGYDHAGTDNPDVAHETHDVNVRAIISFGVGLFVVTAVVYVLMYGLFQYFTRAAAQNDPIVSPLALPSVEMPRSTVGNPFFGQAQGPQLLTNEPGVLSKQRKMEHDMLHSYGWVDQKSAIARLPISEAKKLILQRGLPARPDGADPSLGTRRAAFGESSSGRTIPGGRKKEEGTREEGTKKEGTKEEATKQEATQAPAPPATHKQHDN